MLKFNITFTSSPSAVSGTLEYRHVYPNGTFSPWVVNTMFTNFPINTNNGTVLTHTLNDITGNAPEFWYNTSYQFRIKQTCYNPTGNPQYTDLYSDIVESYDTLCPPTKIEIVSGDSNTIQVMIYHQNGSGNIIVPLEYSITQFKVRIFKIDNLGPALISSSIVVNYADVDPIGQFYLIDNISDDNYLIEPISKQNTYYARISFVIITGTGSTIEVENCPPSLSTVSQPCYLWKINTANSWYIQWTDCNGNTVNCGGNAPYGSYASSVVNVCSPTEPKAYYCKGGLLVDPEYDSNGQLIKGAEVLLPNAGPCDSNLYSYLTNVNPPVLNGFTCKQCSD